MIVAYNALFSSTCSVLFFYLTLLRKLHKAIAKGKRIGKEWILDEYTV